MKRLLATTLVWLALLSSALAGEPRIFNWLGYGPPVGFGKHPWAFRREVLDPMFGSRQPHFMFHGQCFKDNDPLKPQPQNVVEVVKKTATGPLGKYYDDVVILNIEFTDYEDLERNWNPMRTRGPDGEYLYELEPGAMHKLIWFVGEVKRGLPEYKVGLWNHLPSWRMHLLFNEVKWRDVWWDFNIALAPLGKAVDFTCPHFYWVLNPNDKAYFTHAQRTRGIQLTCMASHEIYRKPCYPCIWPECYRRFQTDPWPDNDERRLARQMTRADMENTVGACLEYGDGFVLWSQKLNSAPSGQYVPFRWDDPWVPVLIDAGRGSR